MDTLRIEDAPTHADIRLDPRSPAANWKAARTRAAVPGLPGKTPEFGAGCRVPAPGQRFCFQCYRAEFERNRKSRRPANWIPRPRHGSRSHCRSNR